MNKYLILFLLLIGVEQGIHSQNFPQIDARKYESDSIRILPKRPWLAASEAFGVNMLIWGIDRYVAKADFAYINFNTIKDNFRKGPVWDTDMFSTNLVAHPYHGSLYFNAARSNGLNFWQSVPYNAAGSFMWEFFMENEYPSINDLMSTTFGGAVLGEITFRLSDLFIDDRTTGAERVGREILTGIISPIRGINRLITGDSWRYRASKGRSFRSVPVTFELNMGPRFLAEQEASSKGTIGMHLGMRLDYGDPFNDDFYSPYEWFQLRAGLDFISDQPMINQVNAIGALWGKTIWTKGNRGLTTGIFQHFDYYDSQLPDGSSREVVPYRISEAVAFGGGLLYKQSADANDKVDSYAELYLNGIALGASVSDYMKVDDRDYNMGSGYSFKFSAGVTYQKQWSFLLNLENYHIYTWKGYDTDVDWSTVDPETLNVQGDKSDARLTVFSSKLIYYSKKKWNLSITNRYFSRKTDYRYYQDVTYSTYDVMLSLGMRI